MLNFVVFVFIFYSFYQFYKRYNFLRRKVELLEKQVADVRQSLFKMEKEKQIASESVQVSEDLPESSKDAIEIEKSNDIEYLPRSGKEITKRNDRESNTTKSTDVFPQVEKKKEPKRKSRTRTEWELLIGGKWLNWIGAVALFLGAAFFMKYAFDNNWINEQMRVLIGALFGVVLLFAGRQIEKKGLSIFSQGLVGTGIAVLYTAVFAAYNFYALMPQLIAIILMFVVTILCFQQAILYQSLPVALLGWIGAFGTPFLLSGEGSITGLMSYLCLILIGMLALVWRKNNWIILYYLSFFATYVIFFGASLLSGNKDVLLVSFPFLICFWLLFYVFDIRSILSVNGMKMQKVIGILNVILFVYGLVAHLSLLHATKTMISISMVLVGIVYVLPLILFYYQKKLQEANTWQIARQGMTFLCCILAATYVYFDLPVFLFVSCLEVAMIIWWGLRYQVTYIERFGLGVLSLVSMAVFIYSLTEYNTSKPIFNWIFGNDVLCAFVLLLSAHWYNQKGFTQVRTGLHVTWAILLFVGIYLEGQLISHVVFPRMVNPLEAISMWNNPASINYITALILLVVLLLYAVSVLIFGLKRGIDSLLVTGNVMLGVLLVTLVVQGRTYPIWDFYTPVWNVRALAFVLSIAALYAAYRLWKGLNHQHPWYRWFRLSAILAMVLLLFELVTVEILDGFAKQINLQVKSNGSTVSYLENLQFYSIVIVWIFISIPMYLLGIKLRYRILAYLALSVLGLGTVPILIHGLSYYSYENFNPIVNVRFLSLVCITGVFFFWYRYMKMDQQVSKDPYWIYLRQTIFFLGVFAVFLCVTMEINDSFKATMFGMSSGNEEVIKLRNMQQLFISISWLLLSCVFLWIGIWKKKQSVRIMSICIFGISILKIFLFDLQFLTTLYRIFSFMGLGVILLVVSFVYQKYKHWFSND